MKKKTTWILAVAATALVAAALSRLHVSVDVFDLLPAESRMVEAMKLQQKSFASQRGLILSLRSPDPEITEEAAGDLADDLEAAGLTSGAVYRNPFRDDADEVAEIVAYLWLQETPEAFAALARRLEGEELAATLETALERIATSFKPREVARLAQDPLSLTEVTERLGASAGLAEKDPFASADGTFRVVFAPRPFEKDGFWEYRDWTARVREHVAEWRRERGDLATLTVRVTGNPAFVADTGTSLLRDVASAALGTLLIVAGLFWLVHRRWAPLVWLVVLLIAVLALTMALGGFLLDGTLNALSLGFAAILLGLAVDYALILYQELAAHPGRSVAEHRAAVGPSILWAALTTAAAFFMVGRSSLPGLVQLGTLVAVGTLVAAGVMLAAFLPPLAGRVGHRPGKPAAGGLFSPSHAAAGWITGLLIVAAMASLAQQLPAVDYDTEQLGPRENLARDAFDEVRREVGGLEMGPWLLVQGTEEGQIAEVLQRTRQVLDEAVDSGLLAGFTLPDGLWPRPEAQAANRALARRLASRLGKVRAAVHEAGFTDEALRLTEGVFAAWGRFAAEDGVVWPESPGARWAFEQFASHDSPKLLALGRLQAAPGASDAGLAALSHRLDTELGVQLFAWPFLSDSLLVAMQRDTRRVLLPMGVLLLVFLALAFRRTGEVLLSLAALGFSFVCLLGVMALFHWSWNLMNVMALPLLFGAGVDYSIHIQLALKRYGGDVALVRHTVGRAILLCGASTAAGFATLAFASNAGLASLGRVCATGIVLATLSSVLLLPTWWRALQKVSTRTR